MFGQKFQHLFPSPGLQDADKPNSRPPKRQNFHINNQSLSRPTLDEKKISREADKYRKMVTSNRNAFLTSIASMDKIRRSLTPALPTPKRKKSVVVHKLALKIQGNETDPSQQQIIVDLYLKIFLFKTELDETPMTFIKGKVDIFSKDGEDGHVLIPKLINYSDKYYDALSCRLIATSRMVKKNQVKLFPTDYNIVIAGFVQTIVAPRSNNPDLQILGPWFPPAKTHPHLTLILCDERQKKILFTTTCFSFEQVIRRALLKDEINQKIY